MKKFAFFVATMFIFLIFSGCSSDSSASTSASQEIHVSWSLSGSIDGATLDSVRSDLHLTGVNRSSTPSLRINGFDTTYFEKKVSVMHVLNMIETEVDVDDLGNFTFDAAKIFCLQGRNNVRITPKVKEHVIPSPWSITLNAMVY